jgi:hypothetical protein
MKTGHEWEWFGGGIRTGVFASASGGGGGEGIHPEKKKAPEIAPKPFMLKSIRYRYTDGSLPSSLSLCRMARTLSVVLDNAHRMKAMGRMKSNAVYMLNS